MKNYWNLRVVKMIEEDEAIYEVCEVHYSNDVPHSFGRTSTSTESREDLVEKYQLAFSKPTLFFDGEKLIESE